MTLRYDVAVAGRRTRSSNRGPSAVSTRPQTTSAAAASRLETGDPLEPHIRRTLEIKPERHQLVQGSAAGSGGLLALSQVGG